MSYSILSMQVLQVFLFNPNAHGMLLEELARMHSE